MADITRTELPFWKKVIFGTGDVYAGGGQQLVGFLYLFFLTDVVGLKPYLAGLVLLLSKVWDAISDPMMGVISDRTRSRFGRRRPYFLAGIFLVFLSFSCLWLPVRFGGQLGMFLFALAVWLFHETINTMVLVPFYALGGDLTEDYHERNQIMFSRLFISTLTIITVALLPKMIVARFADPRLGYAIMGAGFAALFSLPWIAMFFTFPEKRDYKIDPSLTVMRQVTEPLRLKSFRQLMVMFIAGYTAVDLMSTVFIYYMTYYLQRPDYNLVLGSLLVGQALLLPVALSLTRILGKKRALVAGYLWWAGMIILMAFINPSTPRFVIYIITFLMGGGSGAAAFIPWAIFPDVADVGELAYGERREGVYGGFLTFARKCCTAVAGGFFGIALSLAHFVQPADEMVKGVMTKVPQTQPGAVTWVIRAALFLVPLLLMLLGLLTVKRFQLTKGVQEKLTRYLSFKRGETTEGDLPLDEVDEIKKQLA